MRGESSKKSKSRFRRLKVSNLVVTATFTVLILFRAVINTCNSVLFKVLSRHRLFLLPRSKLAIRGPTAKRKES
jgi:hypothetical protein